MKLNISELMPTLSEKELDEMLRMAKESMITRPTLPFIVLDSIPQQYPVMPIVKRKVVNAIMELEV